MAWACTKSGNIRLLRHLVQTWGVDPDTVQWGGSEESTVWLAAFLGNTDICAELLDLGARLDLKTFHSASETQWDKSLFWACLTEDYNPAFLYKIVARSQEIDPQFRIKVLSFALKQYIRRGRSLQDIQPLLDQGVDPSGIYKTFLDISMGGLFSTLLCGEDEIATYLGWSNASSDGLVVQSEPEMGPWNASSSFIAIKESPMTRHNKGMFQKIPTHGETMQSAILMYVRSIRWEEAQDFRQMDLIALDHIVELGAPMLLSRRCVNEFDALRNLMSLPLRLSRDLGTTAAQYLFERLTAGMLVVPQFSQIVGTIVKYGALQEGLRALLSSTGLKFCPLCREFPDHWGGTDSERMQAYNTSLSAALHVNNSSEHPERLDDAIIRIIEGLMAEEAPHEPHDSFLAIKLERLIANGVDINRRNNDGYTALQLLCQKNRGRKRRRTCGSGPHAKFWKHGHLSFVEGIDSPLVKLLLKKGAI